MNMNMFAKVNKPLIYMVLILLLLFPRLYISSKEVGDFFVHQNIAFVQRSLENPHILPISPLADYKAVIYHPAQETLLLTITKITGLPVEIVEFLPVGGISLLIAAYIFYRKSLKQPLLAALLTFALSYEVWFLTLYTTFLAAWACPLFFIFIYTYLKMLQEGKKTKDLIILLLCFVGMNFFYYSVTAWAIAFVAGANFILFRKRSCRTLSFLFACVVIFLGFNMTLYDVYLPVAIQNKVGEAVVTFLLRVTSIIGFRITEPEKFCVVSPIGNPLLKLLNLVYALMLLAPVAMYVVVSAKGLIRAVLSGKSINENTVLVYSLLLVFLLDIFAYLGFGGVSFRLISLIFPFLAIMVIKNHIRRSRLMLKIFILMFLMLTAARFVLNIQYNSYLNPSTYAQVEPSAIWLIGKTNKEDLLVLSDLDTGGRYLVKASRYATTISLVYYDSEVYEKLLTPGYDPKSIFNYLAVNRVTLKSPIQGMRWKYYEPLSQHLDQIRNNPYINKIYDDNNIWLFGHDENA